MVETERIPCLSTPICRRLLTPAAQPLSPGEISSSIPSFIFHIFNIRIRISALSLSLRVVTTRPPLSLNVAYPLSSNPSPKRAAITSLIRFRNNKTVGQCHSRDGRAMIGSTTGNINEKEHSFPHLDVLAAVSKLGSAMPWKLHESISSGRGRCCISLEKL